MTPRAAIRLLSLLGITLLLVTGCSGGEEAEPPVEAPTEPAAASTPEADTTTHQSIREQVARLGDLRQEEAETRPGSFAHDPHREIDCSACHSDPPGHQTHAAIVCGECHGVPEVAFARVPSPAECAACHHAESRADQCTRCHDDPGGPPDVTVTQAVDVAGVDEDPVRELLFRHGIHEDLSCTTCHQSGENFGVDRDCASCHENHHRPAADCLSCHAPLRLTVHDRDAHKGCGGTGCHDDPAVLSFPPTRSVCLSCHQDQVTHEPGRDCARCHQVSRPEEAAVPDEEEGRPETRERGDDPAARRGGP